MPPVPRPLASRLWRFLLILSLVVGLPLAGFSLAKPFAEDWLREPLATALRERLGLEARLSRPTSARWSYAGPSEVLEEMGRVVPEYAGVKYQRIEKAGLQVPVWDDEHPGTPWLFEGEFPRGRGKFHAMHYKPAVEMPGV